MDRLRGLPGVTGVTGVNPLPLDGGSANMRWGPPAAASDPKLFQQANLHVMQPGYFEVMGTRVIEGRTFTAQDNDTLPQQLVVDANFARKAFPGQSAVGKEILARIRTNEAEPWTIIGVVAHQRHETLAHDGPETVYVPDGTFFFGATSRWVIRTSGDPAQLAAPVRAAIRELDPTLAITDLQPMSVFVDRARAPTRFALVLIGIFSVIAVLLGAVGLFGVLATLVRQRTAEIGVRMAFGAPQSSILRLFVGYGMRLSIIGVVIGVGAGLALTRVMQSMLVEVGTTDPLTFSAVALLFLAIAAAAGLVPARQAAALDPNVALREE
jgi:predicted permease